MTTYINFGSSVKFHIDYMLLILISILLYNRQKLYPTDLDCVILLVGSNSRFVVYHLTNQFSLLYNFD